MSIGFQSVLCVGVALSLVGVVGLLLRKNLVLMLMSLEITILGAVLALVGAARYHTSVAQPIGPGADFVFFVLIVAACEVAIGLALVLEIFRTRGTLWVDDLKNND